MRQYRCEHCGCRLDPGEGYICEDCQAEREERRKRIRYRGAALRETKTGQMELDI